MKKIILSTLFFASLSVGVAQAQSIYDAIRFSQNYYEGTARFTSMGGAFSALGGDFTSLSINPAGLGVYRGYEFMMTNGLSYSSTKTSYENVANAGDSKTTFGIPSMGFVYPFHWNDGSNKGLISLNLGFGYNKMNNFNYNAKAAGRNIGWQKSMIGSFLNQTDNILYDYLDISSDRNYDPFTDNNSLYVSDWPVILAWETSLIDTVPGFYDYYDYLPIFSQQDQLHRTKSSGSSGEYVLSLGANISHKLYVGLTFGMQDINHETSSFYKETMLDAPNPANPDLFLRDWGYEQHYRTEGFGYNLKVGLIYRPIPELRLAFAAHTPTWFDLRDSYQATMWSNFHDGYRSQVTTPTNYFDYRLNTPYKLIGGIAYTFKQYGLISVDYEFVDYASTKMKDDVNYYGDNSFSTENQIIKNTLKGASNVRVGLEANLPANFVLRAGYSYYGSPYKSKGDRDSYFNSQGVNPYYETGSNGELATEGYSMGIGDNHSNVFSAGVGYRFGAGYIDFAYATTRTETTYFFDSYRYGVLSSATTKNNFNRFILTLGFRF